MKPALFNSFRCRGANWLLLLLLTGLACGGNLARATDSLSSWSGSVGPIPPNIDATSFYNSGSWNISVSPRPFMTANTLNYTNVGTMSSSVGWEFDWGPSNSGSSATRGWASRFFNGNKGIISTTSALGTFTQLIPVGYLLVSATNLVNKGVLSADSYSQMTLTGSNVDLSRSTVEIIPTAGVGSFNNFVLVNFGADTGIFDQYWGQTNITFFSSTIWNGSTAVSPIFGIAATCGATGSARLGFFPAVADSITNVAPGAYLSITTTNFDGSTTNVVLATNVTRQAVFVNINDPSISAQVRYSPSSDPTNYFNTVAVRLSAQETNFATLAVQTTSLYVVDTLASTTNRGLLPNSVKNPYALCSGTTLRPANFVFSRIDQGSFGSGRTGDGKPAPDFLFQTDFTTNLVTAPYGGYSAQIDNQSLPLSSIFGINSYALTNQPGRVQINAGNLNLNLARIRGEGQVMIQASNLISSAGAVVDCQSLSYNLGSSTGFLNVTNIAQSTVSRFHGPVSCWSAVWVNTENYIITNNWMVSTDLPPVSIQSPLTNSVTVGLYALLVDASGLQTRIGVTVQDLILHSTNILVSDSLTVARTLLFDGQGLTLQGTLNLSGTVQDWTYANAPTLLYFTNNGVLNVPNNAHFGDDGPTNYAVYVNNGTINAGSETINSTYYQNGGNDSAAGGFFLTAATGKIENASINSGQDVDFNAGSLKLNNSTIVAGNSFNFNVTDSLFDAGGSAGNQLTCDNGFHLLVKPATGDLLGTTITSLGLNGAEVDPVWAGENRGAVAAGFSNNVAIGKLVLSPQGVFEPLFHFSGVDGTNGLYVDVLDLSQLSTNYAAMLQIDPNLVIYYASAQLGFAPPANADGLPQEPEEYLNGQLGGRLRWVSSFAGPNSSVDVLLNGHTVSVNRALRYSKIIDSNGDGIPNFYDANPFNALPVVLSGSVVPNNPPPARAFAISWKAAPNTVYQVQFTTNLLTGNWQPLMSYTNTTTTNQAVTIWDTNVLSRQRFYRESASGQSP